MEFRKTFMGHERGNCSSFSDPKVVLKLCGTNKLSKIQRLKEKGDIILFIVGPSVLYDPITVNNESLTDSLDKTYYYIVEEHESFLYEGRADNEAPNSDNDDYEDPDFADGDLNEVNKIITVCDYNYIPEVST